MRQQKPVQHHIHVVLCEVEKGKIKTSEREDICINDNKKASQSKEDLNIP